MGHIVVVTCEYSSRLAIRLDQSVIIACDSPDEAWSFNDRDLPDHIARLTDGWANEYERQRDHRAAA